MPGGGEAGRPLRSPGQPYERGRQTEELWPEALPVRAPSSAPLAKHPVLQTTTTASGCLLYTSPSPRD
eukprot:3275536-Alexandrium_andersonii.AAC.1